MLPTVLGAQIAFSAMAVTGATNAHIAQIVIIQPI
jgi:hypothetical protein